MYHLGSTLNPYTCLLPGKGLLNVYFKPLKMIIDMIMYGYISSLLFNTKEQRVLAWISNFNLPPVACILQQEASLTPTP